MRRMPVFPSEAWVEEFCARVREHPDAAATAEALDGVYRLVVEPAGPLEERHAYDVAIHPDGDGGMSATPVPERVDHPRLELRATYPNWRRLISEQQDVGMAVMLRRLRVRGDLSRVTRQLSSARPLTDALSAVDTQWLE